MTRMDEDRVLLTPVEFTDRVMATIMVAPRPTPTRAFVSAVRAGATRDALAALEVAWHLGTVQSWYVAPRVRARSFALVLAVTTVLATGSLAAAGAVRVVAPPPVGQGSIAVPDEPGVDELGPAQRGQTASDEPAPAENPSAPKEPDPFDRPPAGTPDGLTPDSDEPDGSEPGDEADDPSLDDEDDQSDPGDDEDDEGSHTSEPDDGSDEPNAGPPDPDEGADQPGSDPGPAPDPDGRQPGDGDGDGDGSGTDSGGSGD